MNNIVLIILVPVLIIAAVGSIWLFKNQSSKIDDKSSSDFTSNLSQGSTPRSFDFKAARTIEVIRYNDAKPAAPSKKKIISDSTEIDKIISLLDSLPREGDVYMDMLAGIRHEVTACNESETPFAHFTFYGEKLQAENTAFFEEDYENEAALYKIIFIED